MPLAGPTLVTLLGPICVTGLEFCAWAERAKRQEKTAAHKIPPRMRLVKNVFIIRLRNKIILGWEKERGYWPVALRPTLPSLTPT